MTPPPGPARRSLTLLHLSDPQFGHHHREATGATAADRDHDTLCARLLQDLAGIELDAITTLAFQGSTRLASGSRDGTVQLWRLPSLTLLATIAPLPEGWVAFAPDGRYKTGGRVAGHFWHAAALCRFELGELDDIRGGLRLAPDDALLDPDRG